MSLGIPVIVSRTKIDNYYFNDYVVKFFRPEDEMDLAEKSFSSPTQIMPTETVMLTPEKSPAPGAAYLVLIIMSSFIILRTKRPKP